MGVGQLLDDFRAWYDLLDLDTGRAKGGKEKECLKLAVEMQQAASEMLRRIIRKISEEV